MTSEKYFLGNGIINIKYANGNTKTIDEKGVIVLTDKNNQLINQSYNKDFDHSLKNEEMISICNGMIIDLYGAKFKLVKVED